MSKSSSFSYSYLAMDLRVFEFQSELTDLIIRISSLDASDVYQSLMLSKAIAALNQASLYLNKFDLSSKL